MVRRLKPSRHAAFESMITADAQARERRLAEIKEILSRTAPPEDRELLLGFAPVVFAETQHPGVWLQHGQAYFMRS